MLYAIFILVLFNMSLRVQAEIYTSVAELEDLLEAEKRVIDDLEAYIQKEEEIEEKVTERLATLKRYLHIYKKEHNKAMEDIPTYLGNPINAFTLIKRLTIDLANVNETIKIGGELTNKIIIKHKGVKYPSKEDLTGAAQGLARLQTIYQLDVKELAEGKILGVVYSTPMTSSDCYELGKQLYSVSDYQHTVDWMFEAFRIYHEDKISFRNITFYSFTDNDILDHMFKACHQLEDPSAAVKWMLNILSIDSDQPKAIENLEHYQTLQRFSEEETKLQVESDIEKSNVTIEKNANLTKNSAVPSVKQIYGALCRGEMEVPIEMASRLTCRYKRDNHPFLLIAPFKIEMMYLKPDVVLFHEIVSDKEIETLKQIARPQFNRALVKSKTGGSVIANSRISKMAWLADSEFETVARLNRRVTHMTGLTATTADKLQVLNYGIGGHYDPHFDFFGPPGKSQADEEIKGNGNRIATTLFYMSNVTQGGATVFTSLGVRVEPVKGTAIMWFNLHPSGSRDNTVKHGACPVLQGSKWVFTKWLYQVGQEFIKPCNLEYELVDHHLSKILKPVPRNMSQADQVST